MSGRGPRGDDSRAVSTLSMHHDEQPQAVGLAQQPFPSLSIVTRGVSGDRKRIEKDLRGIEEVDAVLHEVCTRLFGVPFEPQVLEIVQDVHVAAF